MEMNGLRPRSVLGWTGILYHLWSTSLSQLFAMSGTLHPKMLPVTQYARIALIRDCGQIQDVTAVPGTP
jgi:hypothetical protein